MKTQEFGSVSKAALFSALGFAKNHKETDYSSCYRCPQYKQILKTAMQLNVIPESLCGKHDICKNCKKKRSTYINEANRYGSDKGKLNAGSVLLFLYLHLCSPNGIGVIPSFSISEASHFLNCDHKTVRANLESLVAQNYIFYSKSYGRGNYSVAILSYADAFKPAKEGGRGYITISKKLLLEGLIPERRSINLLRLDLRSYMEIDNGDTSVTSCRKTMDQIRLVLPNYLRPGFIHDLAVKPRALYSVKQTDFYSFFLNSELNAKLNKLDKRNDAYDILTSFLSELNLYLLKKREDSLTLLSVPKEYIPILACKIRSGNLEDITFSKEDFEDLLQMSVQYSVSEVLYALQIILKSDKLYPPIGPRIRNIIIGNFQTAV